MKNNLFALLLIFACGFHAQAAPLDDKIKAFDEALKTENPPPGADPMYAARMAQQFEGSEMVGQETNLEPMVRQMMATHPSKAIQQAGQELLDELQARKKARLDELTTRIDAALAPVPAAVAKADKPADLDAVLASLQRLTPSNMGGYGYDPITQTQNARVTAAYQFVAQWQDYLSYRDTKNPQQELNTLRNLLNNNNSGGVTIVPRSEILARIAPLDAQAQAGNIPRPYSAPPPADITPILDGIKTLDDIEPAIRQIGFQQNQTYDTAQLTQFAFLYGQAKNGLPISLDINTPYMGGTSQPAVAHIESMVLLYLLPRFLGPAAPAPNPGEQVNDYLSRVMATAVTNQDWALLQHVLDAEVKIAKTQTQQTPPGTQQFLAGLNQEMAAQYSRAVADYQGALTLPDTFTSPKLIADRLNAIKKDHAADYAEGMNIFLHPPAPAYPAGLMNPYVMAMRAAMAGYSPPGVPAPAAVPAAVVPTPAVKPPTPPPAVSTPPSSTNAPSAVPPATSK